MRKRRIVSLLMVTLLTGFTMAQAESATGRPIGVGLVVDTIGLDDRSYNQAAWEGLLRARKLLGVETRFLRSRSETEADYLVEIGNLYRSDFRFIVAPGYKFETAVYSAQAKYKDAKFVLIDGSPNNGAFDSTRREGVAPNTVAIFFPEEQAGFIAGIAAAVQVQTGAFGVIAGMEIPPVQHYTWGFLYGVQYANENFGTRITMAAQDIIYQGTFWEVEAGQELAAALYTRGVKVIFAVAGAVGRGVIQEAKARASNGAFVVGVDVDQFGEGEYEPGRSVILTSATKRVDVATFTMVKAALEGRFPGGKILEFGVKADGVGLPRQNPNLGEGALDAVKDVVAKIRSGAIVVPTTASPDFSRLKGEE